MRPYGLLFLGMNRLGHNLSILNLPKLGLFFDYFREPRLVGVPVLWIPFRWASSRYIFFGISAYMFSVSLEACSKAWFVCNVHLRLMSPFWLKWSDLPDQNWEENSLAFCICDSCFRFAPPTTHHHNLKAEQDKTAAAWQEVPWASCATPPLVLVPKVGKACLGTIAQNLPIAYCPSLGPCNC